jgi:hypothetical protein
LGVIANVICIRLRASGIVLNEYARWVGGCVSMGEIISSLFIAGAVWFDLSNYHSRTCPEANGINAVRSDRD